MVPRLRPSGGKREQKGEEPRVVHIRGLALCDGDWTRQRPEDRRPDGGRRTMDSRKFVKLLRGDWTDYPSRSEADLALLRYLYKWGATENGARDIFLASGMRRKKTLSKEETRRTWIGA